MGNPHKKTVFGEPPLQKKVFGGITFVSEMHIDWNGPVHSVKNH